MTVDNIKAGDSFRGVKSNITVLKYFETSGVQYDLIGKIADSTVLTRRTVAEILKGISKAYILYCRNKG